MGKARKNPPDRPGKATGMPVGVNGAPGRPTGAMAVEMRPLATVRPYPGNPRCNDGAVDAVAASIRQFGFRQPIVVDGAGVIIAGHTRLKAAERLGLKEVPVHVAADLTPAQVRAYRLADNKTAELADWDLALLAPELMTVKAEGIDLLELGFSAEELAELLGPGLDKAVEQPSEPNPEQWLIVITCANESEQKTLLARLQKEGLACQCVIS